MSLLRLLYYKKQEIDFFSQGKFLDTDYRQAEVMKAILLNSADKLQDKGDGNLLGMTRTVLTQKK